MDIHSVTKPTWKWWKTTITTMILSSINNTENAWVLIAKTLEHGWWIKNILWLCAKPGLNCIWRQCLVSCRDTRLFSIWFDTLTGFGSVSTFDIFMTILMLHVTINRTWKFCWHFSRKKSSIVEYCRLFSIYGDSWKFLFKDLYILQKIWFIF